MQFLEWQASLCPDCGTPWHEANSTVWEAHTDHCRRCATTDRERDRLSSQKDTKHHGVKLWTEEVEVVTDGVS